jgi:hypothetical protein
MFTPPKAQNTYIPPAEPIDVNQRYLFKLEKIEDKGFGKYDDPDDPESSHRLLWTFRMATLDRQPILNVEGGPYEHRQYTSSRTGKGNKTAISRLWIEALLGRAVEDVEIGPGTAKDLVSKVAVGLLEEEEKTNQEGEVYTKLKILRLSPYKTGETNGAAPAPKAAAKQTPLRQAQAIAPVADEVPF